MVKLLLIEDEKILSDMYRDKFVESGFDVILSSEAEAGLKITKKEKPDFILLDIILPKKSGVSFLKEMKKDKSIASIPVIALSNYDNPETKKEAIELGVKDYLIKTDYTPDQLVIKIKSLI